MVAAKSEDGALVGVARALSDGARIAWMGDVCVEPAWRGRGVGKALVKLLLDHPAVRGAQRVRLGTRDAQRLYARFGFVDVRESPPGPWTTTEMILRRDRAVLTP
jgi:ribosomal protein S18 acetylase RimI-like enzyme